MNSLLLFASECESPRKAILRGARAKEVFLRHALMPGLNIRAALEGGSRGNAQVLSCRSDCIELALDLVEDPPARIPLILIVAVPRPQTVKKVIQLATAVGVEALHFVASEEVQKSYLQSKRLRPAAIAAEAHLSLEQVFDSRMPEIVVHRAFRRFCADVLPGLRSAAERALLADCRAQRSVRCAMAPQNPGQRGRVVLAIGPESGWAESERTLFDAAGFTGAGLGERILRVETALAILIGELSAICGWSYGGAVDSRAKRNVPSEVSLG